MTKVAPLRFSPAKKLCITYSSPDPYVITVIGYGITVCSLAETYTQQRDVPVETAQIQSFAYIANLPFPTNPANEVRYNIW